MPTKPKPNVTQESIHLWNLQASKNKNGLIEIGINKGFGKNKQVRELVYLFQLNIKVDDKKKYAMAFNSLKECRPETTDIIEKDTKRTLFDLYQDKDILAKKQETLKKILMSFYATNDDQDYYQGLNDVSGFLLGYFDPITCLAIFSGVEKNILRDYTSLKFDVSVVPLFEVIAEIIIYDRPAWECKKEVLMTLIQYVSVSWNLTLFSHELPKDDEKLIRIWDFLIASDPNMILFQISAIVLIEVKDLGDEIDFEIMQSVKKQKFDKVRLEVYLSKSLKIKKNCLQDMEFCKQYNTNQHEKSSMTLHYNQPLYKGYKAEVLSGWYKTLMPLVPIVALATAYAYMNYLDGVPLLSMENQSLAI